MSCNTSRRQLLAVHPNKLISLHVFHALQVTAYCESIVWLHHQYPASPTTLQQKQKAGGNSTPPAEPHQVYYLPKAGSEECQGPGVPAGDSSRASSTLPAVQRTSRVQPGDLLLTSQVGQSMLWSSLEYIRQANDVLNNLSFTCWT
jgi:hypothetical protein